MDPAAIVAEDWLLLLRGAGTTVGLCAVTYLAGVLIAMLGAVVRMFRNLRPLRPFFWAYVEVFRSTPLLVQLVVVFFGLPLLGVGVPALPAALLTLSLYSGAYLSEIVWGGLESVPKGQWEAGLAMGLKRAQLLRHFIVPQAVRVTLPAAVGFAVELVKGSALVSVIGFIDLTKAAQQVIEVTFEPFVIWTAVTLMYFAMCYPLSYFGQRLEQKVRAR